MASAEVGVKVPRLLTVPQLMQVTGLSKWRVYQLVAEGQLPHLRIKRTLRFPENLVAKWIDEQAQTNAGGDNEQR